MDAAKIKSQLRDKLGIKREILALKRMQEAPPDIEEYQGRLMMCAIMQDSLEENKVYYATVKNRMCLGCVATGMDPAPGEFNGERLREGVRFAVEAVNTFQDIETAARAEKEATKLFPRFDGLSKAVLVGPFGKVPDPEVLIIFCNPAQVNLLTRAYCYVTGTFVKGYAGIGACRMFLPDAFINKEPAYTVSDRSWRFILKLAPEELTLSMPPDKLEVMLENLDRSKEGGPGDELLEQAQQVPQDYRSM
jgi:uncharacterized protein (DUF169 family)